MQNGRSSQTEKARVVVLTAGGEFEQSVRTTFGGHAQIDLTVVKAVSLDQAEVDFSAATVVVVDLDATQPDDFAALQRLAGRLGGRLPIIAVTQAINEQVARQLLQVRVADLLIKPVAPLDLVRACARVAQETTTGPETKEAQIDTFLPAAGGAGVTTLAIQTALLLLRGRHKGGDSTCLVDLDFQHGACADYLDLEPRLDLDEIEPQPERLDRQLLEVMLSHHASGLAVLAAPRRPAEARAFDPYVVTRLLDLASTRFDHVVIDLPRTWFTWTDNVLIGSNRLFIVTEIDRAGIALCQAPGHGDHRTPGRLVQPQVIVNRFEQRMFGPGLRRSDLKQALGGALAGTIPNNYGLVREAIDRGVPLDEVKPRNNVTAELRKLIVPPETAKASARREAPAEKSRGLSWAR